MRRDRSQPGGCDQAPSLLRQTLKRIGRYDVETGRELSTRVADRGDVEIAGLSIEQATGPIRDAVQFSASLHELTLLVGGNNAVTRPGVLGLGLPLARVGLITLDAHFDMRDTHEGLSNGNPVRALIEDGLPGANIAQVGLASFANSRRCTTMPSRRATSSSPSARCASMASSVRSSAL